MDACGESQNDALVLKHFEKNYDCGAVYESDQIILADIDPRESAVLSAAEAGHPPTGSDRLLLR